MLAAVPGLMECVGRVSGPAPRAGSVNYRSMRALGPLLGYLGALGVPDPVAAMLERYRRLLLVERRVAPWIEGNKHPLALVQPSTATAR